MIAPSDDLDRIMAIMRTAFPPEYGEAWTRRQVEDSLVVGNCHYILVDADGMQAGPDSEAAGFCMSRSYADEEELLLFAVSPDYRKRGIGWKMLEMLANAALQRGATRIFLEMRRGNTAESLYRAFGFEPVGIRPKYYRFASGEKVDAITFARDIQ
jgi:ribosomal-protein-alanine N-acetyltransferase